MSDPEFDGKEGKALACAILIWTLLACVLGAAVWGVVK